MQNSRLGALKERLLARDEAALPGRRSKCRRLAFGLVVALISLTVITLVLYDLTQQCTCSHHVHVSLLILGSLCFSYAVCHVCFNLGPGKETIQDYDLIRKLGDGGYGDVYHAKHKITEEDVAIKFMQVGGNKVTDKTIHEALRMEACRHPNVVQLKDMFSYYRDVRMLDRVLADRSPWSVCMVMEFCDGGDLTGKIKEWAKLPRIAWPDADQVLRIFKKINDGVRHMHGNGIAHLDLKPGNVLLSKDLELVKVCDLGLSSEEANALTGCVGTAGYIAPEVWSWKVGNSCKKYSSIADLWSLGCILVDMMNPNPYGGCSIEEEINQIRRGTHIDIQKTSKIFKKVDSGDDNWPAYFHRGTTPDGAEVPVGAEMPTASRDTSESTRYSAVVDLVLRLPRIAEDATVKSIVQNCLQPNPDKRWTCDQVDAALRQKAYMKHRPSF